MVNEQTVTFHGVRVRGEPVTARRFIGTLALFATIAAGAPSVAGATEKATVVPRTTGSIISTYAGGPAGAAGSAAAMAPVSLALTGNMLYFGSWSSGANGTATSAYIAAIDLNSGAERLAAGTGIGGNSNSAGPATQIPIGQPTALATDSSGDVYFPGCNGARTVSSKGTVSTVGGSTESCGAGSGGTILSGTDGIAVDSSGALYLAGAKCVVQKITPSGSISTITPSTGCSSGTPSSLVVDASGNLYESVSGFVVGNVNPQNCEVLKITQAGTVSVAAGNGTCGYAGDGGAATGAEIDPETGISNGGIAMDGAGNLYIADTGNCRVRKVSLSGTITTVAGRPTGVTSPDTGANICGFSGDGGPATKAWMNPVAVAADASGNLYVADSTNANSQSADRIRKVDASGTIATVAGDGSPSWGGEGGSAVQAQLQPGQILAAPNGDLYVADGADCSVGRITSQGTFTRIAGQPPIATGIGSGLRQCGDTGDGGPATSASLGGSIAGLALDPSGNLYIADPMDCVVRKVNPAGVISTVTGVASAGCSSNGDSGDGGPATAANLPAIASIAADSQGNLFIADFGGNLAGLKEGPQCVIRKVSPSGTISTIAGNGSCGDSGDGGPAISAGIWPTVISTDSSGDVVIMNGDTSFGPSGLQICSTVRKVSPSGAISGVFPSAGGCLSADGNNEGAFGAMTVDPRGDVFYSDTSLCLVNEVSSEGSLTSVAGIGRCAPGGDGGPASSAGLGLPEGLALGASGSLLVADAGAGAIRVVSTAIPSVLSVSPASGPGTGGTTVTISGSHFTGATGVLFGPAMAASYSVVSDTEITAVSPVWIQGGVDVQVRAADTASALSAGDLFAFTSFRSPPGAGGGGSGGATGPGYWMLSSNGTVYNFGSAVNYGSAAPGNISSAGMAATPDGKGYWIVSATGTVTHFGDASSYILQPQPSSAVMSIAATNDGKGLWAATSAGQVLTAGDAKSFGDLSGQQINVPVVAMAATPDGQGYWLLGGDGGVFTFGDAGFFGSTGGIHLNKPAVAMAPTVTGKGYWFVASDGGIFTYGDASFFGSMGGTALAKPVNGMVVTSDGKGYWMVASDGGVFTFGDAGFIGSLGGSPTSSLIVGFAPI